MVVTFTGTTPTARNFMTHQQVPVDAFALDMLAKADSWMTPEAFCALYPGTAPAVIESYLRGMTEQGWLLVEHSTEATTDQEYEATWAWEATAGLYHFGIQDPPWMDPAQSAQWLQYVTASKPPIPLLTTNEGLEHVMPMSRPDLDEGLFATMRRRRSVRSFSAEPVSANVLRDCLFAGLGVTGFLNTQLAAEDPHLPLTMTPSGGARNPFEGFIYVRNVAELQPGIYHYSALDHSLGLVNPTPGISTTQLFAEQDWTEGAAFGIFLVANFDRSMWKYSHPNAYRVVLMEAGHIAQNILLAATEHGLASAPTGAVSDSAARALLGLSKVRQSLVYAVFVGHPDPEAFETRNFVQHPPES